MRFYALDPILDRRWHDLVASHPRSSVFHQQGWLKALAETYGYRPVVLTSAPAGKRLADGVVFCEIKSWVTGNRLVSLPFTDHTEPLLDGIDHMCSFTEWMRTECRRQNWKYIELRPLDWAVRSDCPLVPSQSFWFHTLSLSPSLDRIFDNLHKSCLQRRIRRAEGEQLSYEKGCTEALLDDFYRLLMTTRRRHHVLPQPRAWFRNLVACMRPNIEVRLVRKGVVPIAAILTLRHRRTVVYKYGCSDDNFHQLAGMPFLFWKLIEESKTEGADQIDFGRTDLDNNGLIAFKDRLGTSRRLLTYFRYPETMRKKLVFASDLPAMRSLFSVLPDALLSGAGGLAYRHVG